MMRVPAANGSSLPALKVGGGMRASANGPPGRLVACPGTGFPQVCHAPNDRPAFSFSASS